MAISKAAAQQAAALQQQQQLAMQRAQMGQVAGTPGAGLVSPYDGTTAAPMLGGYPLEAGVRPASLAGLDAGRPQINATNQTAIAPNGTVNQTVTNENTYENKYYNIITTPRGGFLGGAGLGYGSNSYVDPQTGVMYVQNQGGITGWLKRLFRGY